MFTTLAVIKIAGLVITTEQLVSAGFAALFLASEYLGSNPKIKSNAMYQLTLNYLKRERDEDDKIEAIKAVVKPAAKPKTRAKAKVK